MKYFLFLKWIQIYLNDGDMGNRELLEFFGKVIEGNKHNKWEVGVGFKKDDRLYGNKLEMLKKKNLKK